MELSLVELLGGKVLDAATDGYFTKDELAAFTGKSQKMIAEKLKVIMAAGKLEIKSKEVMDLTGKMVQAPAYRLKLEATAE